MLYANITFLLCNYTFFILKIEIDAYILAKLYKYHKSFNSNGSKFHLN